MLDTLPYGVALFSPGGTLRKSNMRFRKIFNLGEEPRENIQVNLSGNPLLKEFYETLLDRSRSLEDLEDLSFFRAPWQEDGLPFFTRRVRSRESIDEDIMAIIDEKRFAANPVSEDHSSSRATSVEDHINDLVITFDRELRVKNSNRSGLDFLGVDSLEAALDKTIDLFPVGQAASGVVGFLRTASETNEPCSICLEISSRFFELTSVPCSNSKHSNSEGPNPEMHTAFTLVGHDTTETQASKKLELLASATRDQFIRNMSHEMLTPLNCILGFSEILLSDQLSAAQRELVTHILENSKDMITLISQILALAELERGRSSLSARSFDPRALVLNVISSFSRFALDKGLELKAESSEDGRIIKGDESRITQVLSCLVSNAIKFTESGKVSIRWSLERGSGDEAVLIFEVSDTGVGIPAEMQSRVFEAFVQGDGSKTRKFGGIGLGLALAKETVSFLGGNLDLRSEPGSGSTFRVRIPVISVS
jgi:signal transduction histidine kinase